MAYRALSAALGLLLFGLFATPSACTPVGRGSLEHDVEDLLAINKRQGGVFSVLGVVGLGDKTVHPRLEIRELEKNADQWNVYLLGMYRFQNMNQGNKLSYYQIAGIHGRPYIPWDGVNAVDGGGGGYCTHGSNIFLPWHRPYLALFEEILYLNARQAVLEFPDGELKNRYNNALTTFRMPYWDWAAAPPAGEGVMPWSVQRPTISVVLPNGTATIPNPLFSYTFRPISRDDFVDSPWTTFPSTLRDPSSNEANAASRNDLVALELDRMRSNLQSRVYNVLALQHNYTEISNDRRPGDSIESIHDVLHNTLGSDGHMSYLAYSAYDPIFWLHHTNVDRIFAIWQALNPDSYVVPEANPYSTFTAAANSVADITNLVTALHPFHRNDAGDFWTSESSRHTDVYAYTYPELAGLNPNDTSPLVSKVNTLYGPKPTRPQQTKRGTSTIAGAPNFSGQRQYIADIKVHKFGLDGSFNVYVFLGDTLLADEPLGGSDSNSNSNSKQWSAAPSFVGITGFLAQNGVTNVQKKTQEANGAVPLTAALEAKMRAGELRSMQEDVVSAYLQRNLRWRIAKTDGQVIDVDAAPGFQLSTVWAEVEPAKSAAEFPKVKGEYRVLIEATDGRPGGFHTGD
ncbi:hypothetical protein BDV95DRAFT_479733 [Massariosphaeria phaeospora]|uniref:tyrosinase n=1 Tax=Massariosphaeria phaeospora TaxID=100035 RepID=A0A7C8IHL7_9PLEO|nr:hypothetical protein BDV95DRAFT_479733 [Massariosphaeria phaeospora]